MQERQPFSGDAKVEGSPELIAGVVRQGGFGLGAFRSR
jgi:hypothetical protein